MRDDDGTHSEDDVADLDGTCLPFARADEDVLAPSESEEEGSRQKLGAGTGSGVMRAVDGEAKDNRGQSFLVLYWWVFSFVGGNLAADVFVGLASAVGDGVLLVI